MRFAPCPELIPFNTSGQPPETRNQPPVTSGEKILAKILNFATLQNCIIIEEFDRFVIYFFNIKYWDKILS